MDKGIEDELNDIFSGKNVEEEKTEAAVVFIDCACDDPECKMWMALYQDGLYMGDAGLPKPLHVNAADGHMARLFILMMHSSGSITVSPAVSAALSAAGSTK